jgi:hypothetical protein
MSYDLTVVEVYELQTGADAIQQNIPLFHQSGITGLNYPYPAGAPALETGKQYAWRIAVKNNDAVVAVTETWLFRLPDKAAAQEPVRSMQPFAKLKKDGLSGYTIARDELKFEYVNETGDKTWRATVTDVTVAVVKEVALPLDSVPLKRGQNLVRVPLAKLEGFVDKHLYLLEIGNSRGEVWRLKFEYRKTEGE